MKVPSWFTSLTASSEIGTFLAKFVQVRLEPVYDSLENSRWMQHLQQLSPGKKLTVEVALHTIGIFLANKIGKDNKLAAMLRELVEDASPEVVSRMRRHVQFMDINIENAEEIVCRDALVDMLDPQTTPTEHCSFIKSFVKREIAEMGSMVRNATESLDKRAERRNAELKARREERKRRWRMF